MKFDFILKFLFISLICILVLLILVFLVWNILFETPGEKRQREFCHNHGYDLYSEDEFSLSGYCIRIDNSSMDVVYKKKYIIFSNSDNVIIWAPKEIIE